MAPATAVPALAAPAVVDDQTPAKTSKKRKAKADDESADTGASKAAKVAILGLTDAQKADIADVKVQLASKNAAFLGALLVKNGLPKTGRKDELIDRVAENQVLGVPPTCDVCEKKKLVWSHGTGKFSCPGFFDDETKMFKRCKGPVGTDLQRTTWQHMGC